MKNRGSDLILGLVFFGALVGLGIVTIVLSDFALGVDRHVVEMYSENVGFLRRGDPVLIHGMASGKVDEITRQFEPLPDTFDADGRLLECTVKLVCILDVDPRQYLHTDHTIVIEDRGVLGGKLIRIETGQDDQLIAPDQPLIVVASPSVIQAVSTLIDENRETIKQTIEDMGKIADLASNGDGPFGKFLSDASLGEQVERLVNNLTDFSDQLAEEEHSLSRLLENDDLYHQVESFLDDMNSASAKISSGEGTVGRLIMEDATHDDIRALLSDINQGVTDAKATLNDLRDGKGTLGKLFTEDELHDNANTMITKISDAITDLREGDGLLARMIDDTDLADTLESILDQVLSAIEDARETAPVQSLGSFLFGTF